ncbi:MULTISPECIES: GlxA family transcriptional regulator [Chromohalobacter]|uniref:GlxA family transcriptional regulator n=1 Tax=Chromohalobacter TaxID=42054 RepID=UPI001FFD9F23|nr:MULTISPECIES: GlxA family transcriptional regulator [Chromohalobacter]MCK2045858.1 GlxA family transcriptional regulator [Chromohalobacter moromii]MCT8469183.1 GlxA family transcriptional regulator [Chromohalobacter canadensis]MCT8472627.1 GlxA family transcriptional regulator [Chromohalobacter canadensis]MCT8500080.1 GlxA family transcriptional regulator [Chromohalobacter canadensis]
MRLHYAGPLPEPIGFLLLPRFSMMAFFSAVEPLRIANRIAGDTLFTWRVISLDSAPVTASNDMTLLADDSLESAPTLPSIAICASFEPEEHLTRRLLRWLHQRDQDGCVLGGIDTGSLILARAGLLTGHRVTLHWESLPAFRERFPELDAVESLFEVGPRRFSCAGGAAAMDMMLDLIARRHGEALAAAVSEQLVHARMRSRHDQQRQALTQRLGTHKHSVIEAVALMERHLETPLSLARLAARIGISLRQLQRLFEQELGERPRDHYLRLRLQRARQLLRETDRDILSVGLACGFTSASSFSRAYKQHFGASPRHARRGPDTPPPA